MSEYEQMAQAQVKRSRRISAVWIVPLVALGLGTWMVVYTFTTRGPVITIEFATAEGIEEGKTEIKALSVDVGLVDSVSLNQDMRSVKVTARLDKEVTDLLREDTRFWVVRPRVGSAGVSGLGTLLSGAYIELSPGQGNPGKRAFQGLEHPPVTPAGTPGLHVTLLGKASRSLNTGDPVLYHGFTVGRIESVEFNAVERQAYYQLFIQAPYNNLVTTNTRFWNVSGLRLETSADGIRVDTGSLESLVSGGVAFDVPDDMPLGETVTTQAVFRLYPDIQSVYERYFNYAQEYVLLLQDSVRGLDADAPVEYRGVRLGTVVEVNMSNTREEHSLPNEERIPVLIRIEPGRIGLADEQEAVAEVHQRIQEWVKRGLRASLKTGNLLTGRLYVDLNYYTDAQPVTLGSFSGYAVIPTVSSGFAQIEYRVDAVLQKMQKLPIEPVLNNASGVLAETQQTLRRVRSTVARLDSLLGKDATQAIPDRVTTSLGELNQTLQGFSPASPLYQDLNRTLDKLQSLIWDLQPLVRTLSNKPNALIFSGQQAPDPEPRGNTR